MIPLGGGGPRRSNGHDAGGRVERIRAWLVRFGDAWEALDAEAIEAQFAPGALFQPMPFEPALQGKPAIRRHWEELLAEQAEVDFRAELLGAGETYGVAHYRATYRSPAGTLERSAIDGMLMGAFDRSGRCTSLRMWRHAGPG